MYSANCPECNATVSFSDEPMNGEIIECPECGMELEVIGVDPLTLELAPEVEEDWGE